MEHRNTHGGARAGAGRKPSTPDTTQVNWRVSKRAKHWMKRQAMEQRVSIATILDILIDTFIERAE
jgi:hypothetical protein